MGILKPKTERVELWIEVGGFPGFEVLVQYLTPAAIKGIREKATKKVVNRSTRAVEDQVDTDLMARLMIEAMILDWKGLTVDYLKQMMPLSTESEKEITEGGGSLPFSKEELKVLTEYTYSRTFMDEITEAATDMSAWRQKEDKLRGNSDASSPT